MSLSPEERLQKILEDLARIEHERWSSWHRYASKNWTPDNVSRWDNLAITPYQDLSEELKEKDRREVRMYLGLIAKQIREAVEEALKEIAMKQALVHGEAVMLGGRVVTNEELYKQPTDYIREAKAEAYEEVRKFLDEKISDNNK